MKTFGVWSASLLLVSLLLSVSVQSGEKALNNLPALGKEDRLLIDSIFDSIKKVRGVKSDFQEVKILQGGGRLESKGLFLYSREKGLYRKLTHPFEMEVVMTRREIIEKNERGEVTSMLLKNIPQAKAVADIFFSLFSGNAGRFEKHFDLFIRGDLGHWEMELDSKPGSPASRGIDRITIHGEQSKFNRVDLFHTGGGRVTTVYTGQTLFLDAEEGHPLPPFPILTPVP